jgi:hypothetical protein
MSDKDMFDEAFPQDKQIGGNHYKNFTYNLMNLFQKITYRSFKVML